MPADEADMHSQASRALAVSDELALRGLESELASAVSADLLARHPLVRRLGVRRMTRELGELGMSERDAREAAALVHALETLELGGGFGLALEELREAGIPPEDAQQAALEASRIHRSCAEMGEPAASEPLPALAFPLILATALVVATAVLSNWIQITPG